MSGFACEATNSVVKLYRHRNNLEQSIFILKQSGQDRLEIKVCIKPVDFYKPHKFTMVNIVPLGQILGHYRKSFFPLSEEWAELSTYLAEKINLEVENYFIRFDSYEKIIQLREEIEPKDYALDNKHELLIFAAIKTRNSKLLVSYIDKKLKRPAMQITQAEFLKADKNEIDEKEFLTKIRSLAMDNKFEIIEGMLESLRKK